MALLIGCFAYNANAQVATKPQQQTAEKGTVKSNAPQTSSQNASKVEDVNKTLTEYEQVVDRCVSLYQKMNKNDNKGNDLAKEFANCLAEAEKMKNQLEKYRPQMNRTQVNRLNKANEKLSKVMIK